MQCQYKIQQFWLFSVTEDSRLKISSSVPWQQPRIPEIIYFFLWTSTSPHNMGMRRSQRKSFSVLSSSQEMLHPSEFPDFRQVVNAKSKESAVLGLLCSMRSPSWCSRLSSCGVCCAPVGQAAPRVGDLVQPPAQLPCCRHRALCWERSTALAKKMEPGVN